MVTDHCGSEWRGPDGYLAATPESHWLHTCIGVNECALSVLTRVQAEWWCVRASPGGMNPLSLCVCVCVCVNACALCSRCPQSCRSMATREHIALTRVTTPVSLFPLGLLYNEDPPLASCGLTNHGINWPHHFRHNTLPVEIQAGCLPNKTPLSPSSLFPAVFTLSHFSVCITRSCSSRLLLSHHCDSLNVCVRMYLHSLNTHFNQTWKEQSPTRSTWIQETKKIQVCAQQHGG